MFILLLFTTIAALSLYILYKWIGLRLFSITWDLYSAAEQADAARDASQGL